MTLIKTSVLTGISTIIKVISAFVINKVIAIYVGPSGLAIVGQLQNFMELIVTFSNGAITNGIVKYTAEYQTIEQKQKIFSSSIVISLVCSLIISIFLFGFSDYLSKLILKDVQYSSVFLFALNTVLNGQKYILVNIASSIFFLIIQLNLMGALVVNQSVIFFVIGLSLNISNKESLSKLSRYSLTVSHLIIRNYIGENLGWDSARYLVYHNYIFGCVLSSEIQDNNELKKEIFHGYKINSYIFTKRVHHSDKFMPMMELFAW